jgi:uracil-DNA glycosylase
MSSGPVYLQVFSSDALKRLHGCAVAEVDRGTGSPCHRLARVDRRPQIGFGNPSAPIVFLSPSPLDPSSATGEAFNEWLEREANLVHHFISERMTPYFRFTRAVLKVMRERWDQKPEKHDALELAFHSWVSRCPTDNPDRVTDLAVDQCGARHLDGLLQALPVRAVVALGGTTARYFWARDVAGFEAWRPIESLHGRAIRHQVDGRSIPVILSVHPFQRELATHPEVVARALTEALQPQDLLPSLEKAA